MGIKYRGEFIFFWVPGLAVTTRRQTHKPTTGSNRPLHPCHKKVKPHRDWQNRNLTNQAA